jgi:hypothetical protein
MPRQKAQEPAGGDRTAKASSPGSESAAGLYGATTSPRGQPDDVTFGNTEQAPEQTTLAPPQLRPYLFRPGQSGNPGGRPQSLGRFIRERTENGGDLVAFHLAVVWGTQADLLTWGIEKTPTVAEKQASTNWLADRGFGKAKEIAEGGGSKDTDWLNIAAVARPEELEMMLRVFTRWMAQKAAIDVTPREDE